jgi:hypothetical protein
MNHAMASFYWRGAEAVSGVAATQDSPSSEPNTRFITKSAFEETSFQSGP